MATWSHIQGAGNDSTAAVTSLAATFGSSITVGNFIVVGVAIFPDSAHNVVVTVSDSKGNTYARAAHASAFAQDETLEIWYARVTTGGTGNAVTAAFSSGMFANISIDEYSTTSGQPAPRATNSLQALSSTTISIPLTFSSIDLFYAICSSSNVNGLTFTAGSGFTLRHSHAFNSGVTIGFGSEDKLDVIADTPCVFNASAITNIQGIAVGFGDPSQNDVAPLLPAM